MPRAGIAHMPLHGGRAPRWLFERMVPLSREILVFLVTEFGRAEALRRLADPFWFQALGCVLGFDWHSSGLTTTVCGAIKQGLKDVGPELGLHMAGGKGATSRKAPAEIMSACERSGRDAAPLVYASRITAKVDSAAVQDGYQLYHHAFFFTVDGDWCVVQQGMSDETAMARRYHWLSEQVGSFVNQPHSAICGDARAITLDLVAPSSAPVRDASATLAAAPPATVLDAWTHVPLLQMPRRHDVREADISPRYLQKILLQTYAAAPPSFEALLALPGVGAKTLRALALTSELIYGLSASRTDPACFSFAHGGKDGTPFPVDRTTYDRTIDVMRGALNRAHVGRSEKVAAFRRLADFDRERAGAQPPSGLAG